MGDELLPDWQLFDAFFQLALQRSSETVYFRVEQTVPYKEVMRVMNVASRAGFMSLALVTDLSENSTTQEPPPLVSDAVQIDADTGSAAASVANSTSNTLTEAPLMKAQDRNGVGASINSCWNIGSLSSAAQRVKLVLRVAMNEDGTPIAPSIQMVSFEGGDKAAAQQSFEAAKRAVLRGARGCGGYAGYQDKFAKGNAPEVLQIRFNVTGGAMLD